MKTLAIVTFVIRYHGQERYDTILIESSKFFGEKPTNKIKQSEVFDIIAMKTASIAQIVCIWYNPGLK